jgi:hypothetical protein
MTMKLLLALLASLSLAAAFAPQAANSRATTELAGWAENVSL